MTCNLKYTSLLLILLAAFAACSDEWWDTKDPDAGKTPIELSVSGTHMSSSATRAVITDNNTNAQAFAENTSLYMLLKSDNIADSSKPALVTRTIMFAVPQSDNTKNYSEVNYSASKEYDKFVRFWEDSYSRSSALSILAVCTPGMGPNSTTPDKKTWNISGSDAGYQSRGWEEISSGSGSQPYTSIFWPVSSGKNNISAIDQSLLSTDNVSFIKNEDLCFSNNLGDWSSVSGKTDARLKFNSYNDRKFDSGRLVFYHALSKLTFKIKEGSGFAADEFAFKDNTNIKLTNFNNSGTFDMENGEFIQSTLTHTDINKIYNRPETSFTAEEKTADYKYILDALVIPGTEMNASTTGVDFFIGNNTIGYNEYKLSMTQLYDAIIANKSNWPTGKTDADYFDSNGTSNTKLKAGIHYVFTFTVGKTKIEKITAQLVPWEEVTSIDFDASNARIELELLTSGTPQTERVTFYRALNYNSEGEIDDNWEKYDWLNVNYETGEATYSVDHWTTTNWLWESNRHFYHFRALMPDNVTVENNGDPSPNPTFNLAAKKVIDTNDTYEDIKWGAPFLDTTEKLTYSTSKGFDGQGAEEDKSPKTHQIYKAIGPTKETITLVSFHMMSEVTIKVQTTANFDNVDFDGSDNTGVTKVELLNCYENASVQLGDGLVTPKGERSTIGFNTSLTSVESTQTAKWGMVPQSLEGVKLRVTTADGNQFFVDMDKIKVKADKVTNKNLVNPYTVFKEDGVDKCIVNYWYPDYQYSYTFTLTKEGVKDLVATIVDWETVTADDETVKIQ